MAYTQPQNLTSIADIMSYNNDVSGGLFGIGILVSLYVVITGSLNAKGEQVADAMTVAGFFTSIVGVFLLLMGLINGYHLFFCFMATALPALWAYFHKSG